jgi:predicted phage terminase large subunit-like protein
MTSDLEHVTEYIVKRVLQNKYIPHDPFPKQAAFLALDDKEALYGGAAGGGKSDALLMAALMFVEEPGYNAILFRKTYSDLALPEAIMTRSHEWLTATDASWNGSEYRWTFPSGATLSFGYLNHDKDKYRYQSSAFQFIGFDETTQFPSEHYLYLFSRLRKLAGVEIPLRMRGGTNPGGIGHDWVYDRFIMDGRRPFVPAYLSDNIHLDQDEYIKSLEELDETTKKQLLSGLWVTDPAGKPFLREWWAGGQNRWLPMNKNPDSVGRWASWDLALEDKETSAFSAVVVGEIAPDYRLRIQDVWQDKLLFPDLSEAIRERSKKWNRDNRLRGTVIEGAASGKPAIQTLRAASETAVAQSIIEFTPKGSKEERARRAAMWCNRGMVLLPFPGEDVPWLDPFERQIFNFPEGEYMDMTDAFTQLIIYLENYLSSGWHGEIARRGKPEKHNRVTAALRGEKFNGIN